MMPMTANTSMSTKKTIVRFQSFSSERSSSKKLSSRVKSHAKPRLMPSTFKTSIRMLGFFIIDTS